MPNMIGAVSRAMSEDMEAQLRARQVNAVHSLARSLMFVHMINAALLAAVLLIQGQATLIFGVWAFAISALAAGALLKLHRNRDRPPPRTTSKRTVRRLEGSALTYGLLWAFPCLFVFPWLDGFSATFGYLIITGMITGGAFTLYPVPRAAMAFMVPTVLCGVAGLAVVHGVVAIGPAATAALFLFVFYGVIQRHSDLFMSEFIGRLELEKRTRLIEDLLEDARLEAVGTRQMIEERLAHAQRIEAVGQLTGGIAHNFNNLLTALQGNAELLKFEGEYDPSLVDAILDACGRGADHVQRLLSAAEKQTLNPKTFTLEPLLKAIVRVVEPSLGPGFRVVTEVPAGLPSVYADPAHLENALVSLVLNARDAMPHGGDIVITCRDLNDPPHRMLQPNAAPMLAIAVRDFGIGMDAATRDRAADPFFTTKRVDKGLGLGLSMVAGFARQSKGDISIDSEPHMGTTVTLRLPTSVDTTSPSVEPAPAEADGASVLLVEDFADVRQVTAQMLRSLGYTVLTAAGPEEATHIMEGPDHVDLLLTDIMLSDKITGLQLAQNLRASRPNLPVAFISGCIRTDIKSPTTQVLPKPFSSEELDWHIRRTLADQHALS